MGIIISENICVEFDTTFIEERLMARTMNIPQIPSTSNQLVHTNTRKAEICWQTTQDGMFAGLAGICGIDMKNGHCQVLFAFTDNSIALKETVLKLAHHAFGNLGLRKIHCLVPDGNGSLKMLDSLGFIQEALMRRHMLINGKYADVKWLGLLRSEFGGYSD